MAASLTAASVAISLPLAVAGAPVVPLGFSAAGVTVASSAGVAAATGTAATAGGGGVSGTTIGVIAGGAAAVAGVVVVAAGGKDAPAPAPSPVACAGLTTSVRVLEVSMVCGQREPATITIQNNGSQAIDFQGLTITQTPLNGLYCDNFRVFTSTVPYNPQSVRPGQTLTIDYASDPWCCIRNGVPEASCTQPGNCSLRQDFTILTSVGPCPGGSSTFLVTYGNNCTTVCRQ
jgi:hypothetical protein